MRISWMLLFLALIPYPFLNAQQPDKPSSTEIYHELQKLNFLGTVLYVAAHPDDENTSIISYMANHVKARTAYLSLTRGDGGQNLIGPELRELLGVLRTQELLAARRTDGGEQRFSRANDFGYSKNPGETLEIWDRDQVLSDVVLAIRQLRPDVIINRFDHRGDRPNHGHHTSSAILSVEAFDLANDTNIYPGQLSSIEPWQPKRLYFNTGWWFYGSRENFEKADKSNMAMLDIGTYYPELGLSNNEIAAMARSQHRCQGFGRITSRGSQMEYVELLKGEAPKDPSNLFEGIDTTWSRISGGEAIGNILYTIESSFDFKNPSVHVPDLVKAYALLQNVADEHWKKLKSEQLRAIILACSGLYLEAGAETASVTPGETVKVNIEAVNRSNVPVVVQSVTISGTNIAQTPNIDLSPNKKENLGLMLTVPENNSYTSPYWLEGKGSLGMYTVNEKSLIGEPESPTAFTTNFLLDFEGTVINFEKPVVYRYSKPDEGELYEPFVVLPKATASFSEDVILFNTSDPINVNLSVRSGTDSIVGIAKLNLPKGWSSHPAAINFGIAQKGAIQNIAFEVIPPENQSVGSISPILEVGGQVFDKKLVEINYDHIPKQSVLLPSQAKVVRMNIKKEGERIAYIVGAGDKVPESLEQIGYQVETLELSDIELGSLNDYDGVVMGIRAYNVLEGLKFKQPILLDYVKNGGNMIVQYNTANRWRSQFENIAPFPMTISRERVTDEQAAVEITAKNHPLVNYPNKITQSDFEGWVQERGLYFPSQWSEKFTPILSMADKGEGPKKGSLLVAPYGKGNYIYTGLSFFRELPAGVPGAYKLFANMLSLKKRDIQEISNVKG